MQDKVKNSHEQVLARLHAFSGRLLFAGLFALFLIIGAMHCYAEKYDFFGDFLSAMGRLRIHGGKVNNLPACLVFNAGLVISGLSTTAYFVLRGLNARKPLGPPLIFLGGLGGLLLLATGLIPFDLWPNGHNYSIYTSAVLLSLSLLLCSLQGDSLFGSRENNHTWLIMTLFVGCCWLVIQRLIMLGLLPCGRVLQQKLMVFYFWCFMFRHALLLYTATMPSADGNENQAMPIEGK